MIRNRPASHEAFEHYRGLPAPPYQIRLDLIPELVKLALFPLCHVEPLTSTTIELTGDIVEDIPNEMEWKVYEKSKAGFQLIFVVINSLYDGLADGVTQLRPFSVSLVPASKRNKVEVCGLPFVRKMVSASLFQGGAAYMGLDPFSGDWQFFSDVGLVAGLGEEQGFTDEMGLIYDYFFLNTDVDQTVIVQPGLYMPEERLRRYLKHRSRLLYTPFQEVKTRQIWGVENALEMFVLQEFVYRSLGNPVPQALLFEDGSWHPGLYHAWYEYSGESGGFISEVDFFFPDQRVAVFCDGATHRRRKIKERDEKIDGALAEIGVQSVRISSADILHDVGAAVDTVQNLLI